MNFQGLQFFDGDVNAGDPEVGGGLIMEPVLPFPLRGTGEDEWKLITRPVIPRFSSVSPDTFGKRAQIRPQVTPVIPGLVQNPIFGGAT
jgi:hypothetical protein